MFSMNYRPEVSNGLIANEIVHVFAGRLNGTPTPNPFEVSDWCWKPFGEVEQDVDARPDIYTVWFRKIRNEFWSDIVGLLYGRGSGGEPKLPTP
jgi:isopentenyl-diphosphate Delta-isomerase